MARRPSMLRVGLARGRAAADVEVGDLGDRRGGVEVVDEARRLVDQRPIGAHRGAAPARPSISRAGRGAASAAALRSEASTTPAVRVSRLWRASSGSAYLLATTSPCSVMRMRPSTVPAGWASRASKLEPPPRPTAPPRPWNSCSRRPASRDDLDQGARGLVQLPGRGEVAAVLVGVGIADHHLLHARRGRAARGSAAGPGSGAWSRGAARRSAMVSNSGSAKTSADGGSPGANRPDLLQQQIDLQQVRDRGGVGDDVGADRVAARSAA